jgi:hypothetical protein
MDWMRRERVLFLGAAIFTVALVSGCAGTQVSKFQYNQGYRENMPQKAPECFDASVLLGADMERSRDIAKKVMAALDATIEEEKESVIKAQRNRHWGVFVGSGGEVLVITLKKVDEKRTFVTATTETGFVGAAGMKPWSCEMVDQMTKMASK